MVFPRLQINALILNKLVYLNNFRDDSIGLFPVQSVESAQMRSRLIPCAKSFIKFRGAKDAVLQTSFTQIYLLLFEEL